MKKNLTGLVVLLFISTSVVKAQSEKEIKPPPPPPPPKKVDVIVKAPSPPEKMVYKEIKPPAPSVVMVTGKQADKFYKRNPTISSISRQGNILTLKMKDGKEEKYDMSKDVENKNFTNKYGDSPIPPPPPKIVDEKIEVPPPPPAPPKPKKTT